MHGLLQCSLVLLLFETAVNAAASPGRFASSSKLLLLLLLQLQLLLQHAIPLLTKRLS
jgi:hypothetical protein